jgi:mRNA interferase RelE/StbE
MLKIQLSKKAKDFLKSLPLKHSKQILEKIDKLAQNQEAVPSIQLEGFTNFRRAKSGEYRFIYCIEQDILVLQIILIGKRNDDTVYKNFVRIVDKL